MAIVKIQNATVSRLNNTGSGLTLLESNESAGKTYKTYYKVWFTAPHGLREGDKVSLSGFLGAKVSEWTDKENQVRHTVELSINSPRVDGEKSPAESAPADEPWGAPADYAESTPF